MAFSQTIEAYDLLDSPKASAERVAKILKNRGVTEIKVTEVEGEKGKTGFIKLVIPGRRGKKKGGDSKTLGIIGRLGGIGARPLKLGLVSDADGAITTLAAALKLADMRREGDILTGDVIITTHICPNAPIKPRKPVDFMDSPVELPLLLRYEVDHSMDAILSIDTTKGNRVINSRGFAISPTVKEGYILRVSEDLLDIMERVTGRVAQVFVITTQDIVPYETGVYHINSIMQPATVSRAPVVGVAITAETAVAGCGTGASQLVDIEQAVRFTLEVAKGFGEGRVRFYNRREFKRLTDLYGSLGHLQTMGSPSKDE
jgi:hypothetical protein